jgi:FkbM family methyltransferase
MDIGKYYKKIKRKLIPTIVDRNSKLFMAGNGDKTLRLNYDFLKYDSLVIDLGGYEGQFASDIFSKYLCNVYVFEPVKFYYDFCVKRFINNNKIKPYNIGLGSENNFFNICLSNDGSSIVNIDNKLPMERIEIVNINDFIKHNNIGFIDLIKINIEGAEYELLEYIIASGLIENIGNLQIQFHEIDDTSYQRMNNIKNNLVKTHEITYEYIFVWENWKIK